ncbi:MAG: hypothetical protein ACRC2T_07760 [Thermoguttaceae bacterium]
MQKNILYSFFTAIFITFAQTAFFQANTASGAEKPAIYYLDISETAKFDSNNPSQVRKFWDTLHFLTSVQGIVNSDQETLFLRTQPQTDDFWWNWLCEDGNWLADRTVVRINSVDEFIEKYLPLFERQITGAVVYGEKPYSLSNVASTISGVEKRICLRWDNSADSVYRKIADSKFKFASKENALFLCDPRTGEAIFTGEIGKPLPIITELDKKAGEQLSTGSAKCDAYLWAKKNYLDTNRVSKKHAAYYLDSYWLGMPEGNPWNNTIVNHDFCIANAGFFFELHCWDDETPVDDQTQPVGTDLDTMKAVLKSLHDNANGEIYCIHGFTPWAWKYTSHGKAGSKHEPVPTEWETVRVFSGYNAYIDADALGYSALANSSFYQHFPLQEKYVQRERPTVESLKQAGLVDENGKVIPASYITFYMGDYDSAAWLAAIVPTIWNDPARGSIPCSWAFNPNLDQRVPHILHYVRTQAKESDWFVSGDSGAGYLNPGMLTSPRLDPSVPDGWKAWEKHNRNYFDKYDLDVVGFLIDGYAPEIGEQGLKFYSSFSPNGLIGQKVPDKKLSFGMPTIPMRHDLYGTPDTASNELAGFVKQRKSDTVQYLPIRTILQTPSWHKNVMEETVKLCGEENVKFVDMETFFLLMKIDCL